MKWTWIIILLVFSVVFVSQVQAQTEVSGNQSGTWDAAGSPYRVTGEVVVPANQTLNIEPGVEVNFQGHFKFTVNGNLQAAGAENDSIYFTTDNPATGWGGIRIDSNDVSHFSYCRIEYGKTAGEWPDMHGGALALLGSDAVFNHCVFADNDATASNSGMGGAVYAYSPGGQTRFTDCRFIRNHAYGEGGAIKFSADNYTEITRCEFIENNCLYGGGAISGYMIMDTKLTHCLFVDNYTMYSNGGAVHVIGTGNTLFMAGCTLTNNHAVTGDGGGIYIAYTQAYLANCILYDNPGMYSDDMFIDWGAGAEIHFSNLPFPDGASGGNNMDQNPVFADANNGDYRLSENSPCVDAGTPYIVLGGEIMVDMEPGDYCGLAPSMGAFEYCNVSAAPEETQMAFRVEQNFPNPFNSRTTVHYHLPDESFVSAKVFDVRGHEVSTLANSTQGAGPNSIFWNGKNNQGKQVSQGVYFLRLKAGDQVRNVRMLLVQ